MEIKKIFNIANYKDTSEIKFGMLCKTEDEAKTFCNYLDSLDKRWSSFESYTEKTYWDNRPIVYYFNCGTYNPLESIRESDIILTFSDFDWSLHQHSNQT